MRKAGQRDSPPTQRRGAPYGARVAPGVGVLVVGVPVGAYAGEALGACEGAPSSGFDLRAPSRRNLTTPMVAPPAGLSQSRRFATI
jgi:hypothetical protein